jgi:hypothetical protein
MSSLSCPKECHIPSCFFQNARRVTMSESPPQETFDYDSLDEATGELVQRTTHETILYELASSSNDIIQRVEKADLPPHLDAIKAAKEAERQAREAEQQARAAAQATQQQLFALQELSQEQLALLTRQKDTLSQEVMRLQEEARTEALGRLEEEQERRVRLQWYKITTEFQRSVRTILSQWPSPLDVLAFEAADWNRLSQTKELARRFLEECSVPMQTRVVDSHTTAPAKERAR